MQRHAGGHPTRASEALPKDASCAHRLDSQSRDTRTQAGGNVLTEFLRARDCVSPLPPPPATPPQVSVSSTPQSRGIVLHLKIKEHFEPWHLVSPRWGRLHEHLQRKFFFSLSITVASVSTLRGTEGNVFKSEHLRAEEEKKSWIMQQSQVRMQTLPPTAGEKEHDTAESISCIFYFQSLINEECCSAYCAPSF